MIPPDRVRQFPGGSSDAKTDVPCHEYLYRARCDRLQSDLKEDACLLPEETPCLSIEAAQSAADFFWQSFQTADYDRSDEALHRLLQVNELDPTDDHMTALAGLCSFWRVVEHGRHGTPAASMEPYAIRSVELVTRAGSLNPTNKLTPASLPRQTIN